jgi:hypothetical protein
MCNSTKVLTFLNPSLQTKLQLTLLKIVGNKININKPWSTM